MRQSRIINAIAAFCCLLIAACTSDNAAAPKSLSTLIVRKQAAAKDLFFSGTIKPIRVTHLTSPFEGIVKDLYFTYGQTVKLNQPLLKLSSSKLAEDYQNALVNYLKARNAYVTAKEKFTGSKELMQHELIAKELYDSEQRQLINARLDYLQAKYKLQSLSQQEISFTANIAPGDTAAAVKALKHPYEERIIAATASGIALAAIKAGNPAKDSEEGAIIAPGSQVKAGQVLLTIADLSGIAIDLQIPETDITEIKMGQAAAITGPAFPQLTLKGYVRAIAPQAKTAGSNSGLPTFNVEVVAPVITNEQRQHIYPGMSAKVKISLLLPAVIRIPIRAVFEKNHTPHVTLLKQGKLIDRPIKTGKTLMSEVIVESGLEPGEEVIMEPQAQKNSLKSIEQASNSPRKLVAGG